MLLGACHIITVGPSKAPLVFFKLILFYPVSYSRFPHPQAFVPVYCALGHS